MSADHTTLAGLENQAFALMARLHVILRRQSGRVTDIEYMRLDSVYCRYVLNLARAMPNDDVPQLCEKLEEIYFGPDGLFTRTPPKPPLISRLANTSGKAQESGSLSHTDAEVLRGQQSKEAMERRHIELNEAVEKGYIGRLR